MSPGTLVRATAWVVEHDGDDREGVLKGALVDILATVADFTGEPNASATQLIEAMRPTFEILAGD